MKTAKTDELYKIIGDIDSKTFFDNYWEQQPLHIARNSVDQFAEYISIDEIETLITNTELHFPAVQLAGGVPPEEYTDTENKIVPLRFLQRYAKGATIVMTLAHRLHGPLARLKREMELAFQLECQTNLYLSPAEQQGFNPHYDSHDVFILQVSGSKKFRFYSGGPTLPFSDERFDQETSSSGDLKETVMLMPGDTLYIPRGRIHDAVASSDQPSLHITLGVYAVTWLSFLQAILSSQASDNIDLRQSVPRSIWEVNGEGASEATQDLVNSAISRLRTVNPLPALESLRDKVALSCTQDSTNFLKRITQSTDFQDTTVLVLQRNRVLNVSRIEGRVVVRCHGQLLEFIGPTAAAVNQLIDFGKISIKSLSELDDDQKEALVKQLLNENIIEIDNSEGLSIK